MSIKMQAMTLSPVLCFSTMLWAQAAARFYVAAPADRLDQSPALHLGAAEDPSFAADVKFAYQNDGLVIVVDVTDPTFSEPLHGDDIWDSDGVQIALDTQPDEERSEYGQGCYVLALGVKASGDVYKHCFYPGPYRWDWTPIDVTAKRNDNGYSLRIRIPWACLKLDPANPPKQINADVLVCDMTPAGRRILEWAEGTGSVPTPKKYARVVFSDSSASCVRTDLPSYQFDEAFDVAYTESTADTAAEEELLVQARSIADSSAPVVQLATGKLPAATAGELRMMRISVPAGTFPQKYEQYQLEVVKQGRVVAQKPLNITDHRTAIAALLAEAQQKIAAIRAQLQADPDWSRDAYLKLALSLGDRYCKRVQENTDQPLIWSRLQMEETVQVLSAAQERYEYRKKAGLPPMEVTTATPGRVKVQDGLLIDEGPRYMMGFGHFGKVVADLPDFNTMGVNIIQQERGIHSINPDGVLNEHGHSILPVLNLAEANHVKVDLLLSPHNFPDWVRQGYPDVRNNFKVGFLDYNIDHPQARQATQNFLEKFIALTKDHPAVFGYCLANEPRYGNSGRDAYSRPAWTAYLKERHKTIQALNELYETNYASFEDVPPPHLELPSGLLASRAYYDWGRFNQKNFADWHAWMNGIIKRIAPNIPTHTKAMAHIFWPDIFQYGTDPELMSATTDIAGCDNCGYVGYANAPVIWYDLLHSFHSQPVFNSETHIIVDNTPPIHIPLSQVRSALWRGVVHHLAAETMWVWEEGGCHDLAGNISYRPAAAETACKSMLDIHRLRREIAALNQAKPRIAIFYSLTSVFWQKGYADVVYSLYNTLLNVGQPVTFVSERQLAAGQTNGVDWILLPHTTHVPDETIQGLDGFMKQGGKILSLGQDNLAWDEYHRPRTLDAKFTNAIQTIGLASCTEEKLPDVLTATMTKDAPIANWNLLLDAQTRQPTRGVEYRVVPFEGKTLVFLFNLTDTPKTVSLPLTGTVIDRLTDETVDPSNLVLAPSEPRLLLAPSMTQATK